MAGHSEAHATGCGYHELVTYGERGINPARRESFVITEALEETESLEDFCADWETRPPAQREALRLKRALIHRVAGMARRMHANGIKFRSRCRLRACSLYHSFYHELPADP